MPDSSQPPSSLPPETLKYYQSGEEIPRLFQDTGQLEFARTQELVKRYLPPPPAVVFDIGGGSGVYSCWLAQEGYEVHLVDASPFLVEKARQASAKQPDYPIAGITLGDARRLDRPDNSVDVVLLFGPLYHLTEREDRVAALRETRRVLCGGGYVLAAAICRFASLLDGLAFGFLADPEFARIVERDLTDGQHRNPTDSPIYFTTAFFHHPDELQAEVEDAGLICEKTLAIEGPGWLLPDFEGHWADPARRQILLDAVRRLEDEPSLLGVSDHLMAVARKQG